MAADEEFPDQSPTMDQSMMEETSSERAASLIGQLLENHDADDRYSPTVMQDLQTRGYQRKICEELLDILDDADNSPRRMDVNNRPTGPNGTFIRTTLYTPQQEESRSSSSNIRGFLGVSSATTSQLAEALTHLITHRVDRECFLPATQDVEGNIEAMGLEIASSNSSKNADNTDEGGGAAITSAKAALTISSLGLTAARLYVSLLGKKGAWGAGLVDVGGIAAVSALIRRWCVECRGREPSKSKDRGSKANSSRGSGKDSKCREKEPEKKRSKSTRKSVRINANATFMESNDSDNDEQYDNNDGEMMDTISSELNATFFVTDDSLGDKLTESTMILGGLSLMNALGRVALQGDKNWSPEAREAYLDGVTVALGTISALMKSGDAAFVMECEAAVESLEKAICKSISKPDEGDSTGVVSRRGSKKRSPKEVMTDEKRRKESTVYVLRGLLPLLTLKLEVPNGQSGKIASCEKATAMLVQIISRLSRESSDKRVRLSSDTVASATPKRGGRKSISFSQSIILYQSTSLSHTPGKTPRATLQPPSLKKSITPRRTRSSTKQESVIHPQLSLVMGMLHKLFTSKGLERADARGRVTSISAACLAHFPSLERGQMLNFIVEMCLSKVSSHRLLSVEIIGDVLCKEWYWADLASKKNKLITPNMERIDGNALSCKLLVALQGRLVDKSPTVRMRAAISLGEVVRKANAAREEHRRLVDSTEETPKLNDSDSSLALIDELCNIGTALVDSLRNRASSDEKATVRKASIVAWLEMLSLAHHEKKEDCAVTGLDITTLCCLCNDSSVATRKAAAGALTRLVQANYDGDEYTAQASALEMAWAHSVLPLIRDVEHSCVSKSLEFFSSLIVEPIIQVGANVPADMNMFMLEKENARYLVAWRILSKVSLGSHEAGGSKNGTGSLQFALQKLFINSGNDCKSIAKNLLRAVYCAAALSLGLDRLSSDSFVSQRSDAETDVFSKTIQPMRTGAWSLLNALCDCLLSSSTGNKLSSAYISLSQAVQASHVDASFLALSLNKLRSLLNSPNVSFDKRAELVIAARDCIKVISKMASFIPIESAKACFSDLKHDLKSFSMTIDLTSVSVSALVALTKQLCEDSGRDVYKECQQWIEKVLTSSERAMSSSFATIARNHSTEHEKEKLARILFSIGELSMVGFSSEDVPGKVNQKLATETEPVRGLRVRPSTQLLQHVKLMLPNFMPVTGRNDGELVPTSSTIRAHAFLTLGKLCLRDEPLAKESLNILARELHNHATSDPAVQTNALLVMGDLCTRYTNLVDKYLPFMAACLQAGDANILEVESESRLSITMTEKQGGYALVKKNSILLLSSLLLQDYIKWRGLLLFRFLAAVADKDDEVSCLARTALRGPLLEKQPNLLSSSFVEAIFVFNCCKAHPIYAAAANNVGTGYTEIDFERGLLEGNVGFDRRHEVYQMVLENLSEEQKLKVTTDIVKRILGGALDSRGDLGIVCRLASKANTKISDARIEAATHVLRDAFAVLSSIKVGRRAIEELEDEFAEGNDAKVIQRSMNKDRLLSKISVKHLMEIVIPVLCNLKTTLESSHSALLKDLMNYLGYIFRSFKREVVEHLANDPTLLQELEYDMRQFDKKQRASILNTEIVAPS